jgi:hypothetical protein
MHAIRSIALASGPSGLGNFEIPGDKTVHLDGRRYHRTRPAFVASRIVYYLERRDGCIKIGTTSSIRARRRKLAYEYGPLSLIAWEAGSYALEAKRHERFRRGRCEGEWFFPEAGLMRHIKNLRANNAAELQEWA